VVEDQLIEVNEIEVRRALARSFTGHDRSGHTWRGEIEIGGAEVTVDVQSTNGGDPYVEVSAPSIEHPELDGRLARTLVIENAELVLGRFTHADGHVHVEHAILAGTTMAAVEVQASVWTVAWAALLRDAQAHVVITDQRVKHFLDERFGGFDHDPDWGYHGGFGSARVFVDVLPVLDDSTAVRASSPVLSDIDLTDDLALELMRLAAESPFGCYSYQPARREVWFEHVILGDDLDRPELEAAIQVVADTADGQDDRLAGRFGGRRYADL
jgi:T3SS (YopN, CesT) and YbjN peptide-binding chaperone 1